MRPLLFDPRYRANSFSYQIDSVVARQAPQPERAAPSPYRRPTTTRISPSRINARDIPVPKRREMVPVPMVPAEVTERYAHQRRRDNAPLEEARLVASRLCALRFIETFDDTISLQPGEPIDPKDSVELIDLVLCQRHPPTWHDLVVARREAAGKRAPTQPVILG
jgi:hypothetical protein